MKEQYQKLVELYHLGELDEGGIQEIETAIKEGHIQLEDLESENLAKYFKTVERKQPSPTMDEKFYSMLNASSKHAKTPRVITLPRLMNIAAGILLIISAFWVGTLYQKSQLVEAVPKSSMASMLMNAPKVSDKIHLISNTQTNQGINQEIIQTLLYTLNTDNSANVRLACVESLSEYVHIPEVRQGLVQSISNQSSPTVILNLAETIKLGGEISNKKIEELIDKQLPPPILNTLTTNLEKL